MANGQSRTIATGAAPPSRLARLGEALGTGFQAGAVPAVQQQFQLDQQAEALNPIREALQQSLGQGPAVTPGQAMLQGAIQDPQQFAQFMQGQSPVEAAGAATQLAAPPAQGEPQFPELAEINEIMDRIQAADRAGEKNRARALRGRLRELTGGADIPTDKDVVQLVRPDGTSRTALFNDDTGEFFDLRNNPITPGPGDRIIESTTATGAAGEVLPESQEIKLKDQESATRNFVATARDALQLLEESPDINTFTGRAASFINDVQQEARALARNTGLEFDEQQLDPSKYERSFDQLGIQNARMRGLITSLAFRAAAATGQEGRSVSDRDVRRFIEEVGAQSSDPRAFAANLIDVSRRTVEDFKRTYRTNVGEDFQGELGLETLPIAPEDARGGQTGGAAGADAAPEQIPVLDPNTEAGQQQYQQLPAGARYRVPGDDTVYQKGGGG